ncbi:hypothetical protein [Priestia filamentosa]|nr:hypothetical protein [Priestia filamentosa]
MDNTDKLHNSKEYGGEDKAVDSSVIVVYKKYHHDEIVKNR